HRVPAAALLDAQPAPRAHPRAAARARVGVRLRRRRADPRDLHQLPAQEARRSRPAAHPHGARRRLRAARAADVMASLRGRLIAGLVALAAVGLLALGAITYFEERAFLMTRVDEQARSAPAAVDRALTDRGAPHGF